MARPRQGVTLKNASRVRAFFREALSDYTRSHKVLADGDGSYVAEKALNEVGTVSYCSIDAYQRAVEALEKSPDSKIGLHMLKHAEDGESAPDPDELDAWVLQYVSEKGWRQCLSNLRQSRHAATAGRQKTQVKIDRSTAWGLKRLADERGLSFDEFLAEILKKERGY
jgi:hypothetical protein